MPSVRPLSQPSHSGTAWLNGAVGRRLVADVQRMAVPELTRVFGQHGLYMRPIEGLPPELSGNMLANVLSLYREDGQLAGQLKCLDVELPVSSSSLSLVYCLFMLETSPEPAFLVHEIARALKPEGVAMLISLNPWSPTRLRWLLESSRATSTFSIDKMARDAGLEVMRRQHLGPVWPIAAERATSNAHSHWVDGLRAASMVVLRRRDPGLTPLRKVSPAVSMRPGMSAG